MYLLSQYLFIEIRQIAGKHWGQADEGRTRFALKGLGCTGRDRDTITAQGYDVFREVRTGRTDGAVWTAGEEEWKGVHEGGQGGQGNLKEEMPHVILED